MQAMSRMSEYYIQYRAVVCCDAFDGSAYLTALAERVRGDVRAAGYEIPHLKLLAWTPEGDYGKADLLGVDRPIEVSHRFAHPCTELAVILNASADCPKAVLDGVVTGAVNAVSGEYQLELVIFKKDFFGMG